MTYNFTCAPGKYLSHTAKHRASCTQRKLRTQHVLLLSIRSANTQCSFGSVRATLVIEKNNNPNFYSQFSALAFTVSVIAALIIKQKYISHTRRRVGVRRQIHTCVCVCVAFSFLRLSLPSIVCIFRIFMLTTGDVGVG